MKRIAVFCVTYNSDQELEQYRTSLLKAAEKAKDKVTLDIFVARNTADDNPGYFGGIRRLMENVDVSVYDYVIISNVDLTVEEDFFVKLAEYHCSTDTGWIAPQIWSQLEERDRNPEALTRYSKVRLLILKLLYRFPIMERLYMTTFYRSKKYHNHTEGDIYAGHGSFIILTKQYFSLCGKIDYPVFLYSEEFYLAELCRQQQLKVKYVPTLKTVDKEHISTSKIKKRTKSRFEYEAISYILRRFY